MFFRLLHLHPDAQFQQLPVGQQQLHAGRSDLGNLEARDGVFRLRHLAKLSAAAIAATVITQEQLGQREFDMQSFIDVDVIVVDEAHHFRNHRAQRYQNLEFLISATGRRGRGGERKKVILLTATPINNGIFDLYNQINLFTGGDRAYFAAAGIGLLLGAVWQLAALIGAATLVSYLFIYTPLKRMTTLNTIVGAVAVALPVLLGWSGARGRIGE